MKYSCKVDIKLPRDRIIELFDDPENLPKWLIGLESFTHKSGEPGFPGAQSDIVVWGGNRRVEMVETIETRDLPHEFTAIYTTKGVWNRTENFFTANDDGTTTWEQINEFRCEGLMMKLMTRIMPGMFRKETMKQMDSFKTFAEAQG